MSTRILAMVGSLRAGSYNRQLAEAAVKLAPEGIEIEIYEGLADVPFYNEDLDQPGAVPASRYCWSPRSTTEPSHRRSKTPSTGPRGHIAARR